MGLEMVWDFVAWLWYDATTQQVLLCIAFYCLVVHLFRMLRYTMLRLGEAITKSGELIGKAINKFSHKDEDTFM